MTNPKKLASYDPAYQEMFRRVAEEGREFSIDCETQGKAVYLTQRLRAFRKLLLESAEKDKSLVDVAAQARLVEVAREGYVVLVRPTGGSWASQAIAKALGASAPALPATTPIGSGGTGPGPEDDELPPSRTHGYY
jgi:hypothetical protein